MPKLKKEIDENLMKVFQEYGKCEQFEPCDECENDIPNSCSSMVNGYHKVSCSLFDPNSFTG